MPNTKQAPYDWSKLQTDTEVKSRCTIDVKKKKKKRFQVLQSNVNKNRANTIDNILRAHQEAAELHVPHKPRTKSKSLREGKKVVEKTGTLQDVLKGTSAEVRPKASKAADAKKDLDRAYAEEQEKYVKGKTQESERAHEFYRTSLAWSIVNAISGRKGSSRSRIRASCPRERIKLWKEYFEGLLGQPPVVDDQPITRAFDVLPIKAGDLAMTELREAVKSTQGNKTTGLDGIPVWKLECFKMINYLKMCNRASETKPVCG